MKKITFKHITSLLPLPRTKSHEAWEFRFLFTEGKPRKLIYVEAVKDFNMLRLTFCMASSIGRGRIWLKRAEPNRLDSTDLEDFVRLIVQLQAISGLDVLVSPIAHSLITRTADTSKLFESPHVMLDKRHRPRNYDDPKYSFQESSNPYSSHAGARD